MRATFFFVTLLMLINLGCGRAALQEDKKETYSNADEARVPPPPPVGSGLAKSGKDDQNSNQAIVKVEKKLVKKGSITIKEKNIKGTLTQIKQALKTCDGYLTKESTNRTPLGSYCQLSINVNAKYFERFIFLLDSVKLNITEKSLTSEDITAQYVDNQTRLENKKKLEERYREILKSAKSVTEIMEIESKIEEVRADIESKEQTQKVYDQEVQYSQLEVQISDESGSSGANEKGFWRLVWDKIEDGWDGGKSFLLFLISIWPMYIVGYLVYRIIKWFRRRGFFRFKTQPHSKEIDKK